MEKYSYDGEKFLSRLYNDMHLNKSVIRSSNVSDKKLEKIRKYLDRQERVHKRVLENGKLDLLKEFYYKKYVIEEVPAEYIAFLDKNQFDQIGKHLTEEQIKENKKVIIEDQKKSLSVWIDYLVSEDAKFYPWWAKYWAFQGMLKIGAYDNENGIYGKRDKKTVAPFIELNRESLAKAIDLVMKEVNAENIEEKLKELVSSGSFTKLYMVFLRQQTEMQYDNKNIDGKWIKYNQGKNYKTLWKSLQGYNTGWCTAGESTCQSQIKSGDFYVYYTKDENGEMKVPRLAIRMDGKERIGEIRGVAKGQNIEPHLEKVLEDKLKDFTDAKRYKKRLNNSEMLTYIYTKNEYGKPLTKEDLRFIYEIDEKFVGFGFEEDPRLEKLKTGRNKRKDLAVVFGVLEEQLGLNKEDLCRGKKIKYYYGNLNLSELTDFEIPEVIRGNATFYDIKNSDDLKNLKEVYGSLQINIKNLKNVKNFKLPEVVQGSLELLGLENLENFDVFDMPEDVTELYLDIKSAKGVKLPKGISSLALDVETSEGLEIPEGVTTLYLDALGSAKNLELPEGLEELYLDSLISARDLKLPGTIKCLSLRSLESAEGLELPKELEELYLDSLISARNLKLPSTIKGLSLRSLETAEELKFPEGLEELNLESLMSAKGVKFPSTIKHLDLRSLETSEGLELPKGVDVLILPQDLDFSKQNFQGQEGMKRR